MASSSSNRWDMSNWTIGPTNILNALGLTAISSSIQWPQLNASLAAAAEQNANSNPGSGTGSATQAATGTTGEAGSVSAIANQKLGQQLAAVYGWGSGAQWAALNQLVMDESGWNNTAQNPTSTAYGIGQFLDSTWATVGGTKTSNPTTQIKLMLEYIKQRYGTPEAALAHENANHWY